MANTIAANAMEFGSEKAATNNAKIIQEKMKNGAWDVLGLYIRAILRKVCNRFGKQ
jgi:hypothetical protein